MSLNDQMAGFSDPDFQPVPPPVKAKRHTANVEVDVKVARDRAQYVRQQKPKSWLLHWVILGVFTLWIVPIYYSFSPNYFWKL